MYTPPKMFQKAFYSPLGQNIWIFANTLDSREKLKQASDLDLAALEALGEPLFQNFGAGVKDNQMKKATGHMTRYILESEGYQHVKHGVPCSKNQSVFVVASKYKRL